MASDGGMSTQPNNKAGAKYGTGYCDAQCPHDIKLIGGEANVEGWSSSPNDPNAGKGKFGTCCAEMDIWEANSMGSAFTPHPCSKDGPYKCSGIDCGDGSAGQRYQGVCDKDGCDFNAYRMGATSFYGPGKTVNTNMPMTVVTQFITQGNSDTGALIEIRRLYVQGGKIIYNAKSTLPGLSGGPYDSVTTAMCTATKTLFGDNNHFQTIGGMAKMGAAMNRGMVLVMSIWDDYDARMLWLDSSYPLDKDPSLPGIKRGDCATTSGEPKEVEANGANISVKFSNIKWGEIGSTYTGTAPSTTSRPPGSTSRPPTSSSRPPSPSSSPTNCRPRYQQCGGQTYTGAKCCQSGSTCTFVNTWYSQCI
jgi:cellulose 1,4-beta-cellobiosidase